MRTPHLLTGTFAALLLATPSPAVGPTLAEAVRNRQATVIRDLLRTHVDVNAPLGDGTTALHWAVYHHDLPLVKQLLTAGARTDSASRLGKITPLMLAVQRGAGDVVQALLEAGANPNARMENGTTPLMLAAAAGSLSAVNLLASHGAEVNAREAINGQTPLMFAAAKNRFSVIPSLVTWGATPSLTSTVTTLSRPRFDEDGNPIGAPTGARAGRERTSGNTEERPQRTPALEAALARRASAVVLGGNTALTLAARNGNREAVRALLDSRADIDEPTAGDKTTPLLAAICNGHYDLAKYLLDRGADPNRKSVDGLAPLYATIDTQWAPVGWAPNPVTDQEKIGYLGLMKALLDKGAEVNARLVKKLWFRPTHHDEGWVGTAGATAFWRAAQATDLAAMRLLIAHGADPKIPNIDGDNALMVAAGLGWNGNFSVQGPDSALDTVKYLLDLGLDPVPQDVQGYTAIAGAAYRGDNALITLLVSRGAKLDTQSDRGWSVTDMANGPSLRSSVPVKHPETVALLLKLGAPPLTPTDDEEILGIIRRRPTARKTEETPKPTTTENAP